MNPDTPIVLAAARYSNREDAVADYHAVKHMKSLGDLDHTDIAVLTKDEDGHLQIERHDSTAKHMAWLGAALVVIAPPVGATALATGGAARAHSSVTSGATFRRRRSRRSPSSSTRVSPDS